MQQGEAAELKEGASNWDELRLTATEDGGGPAETTRAAGRW